MTTFWSGICSSMNGINLLGMEMSSSKMSGRIHGYAQCIFLATFADDLKPSIRSDFTSLPGG